MITELDPSEEAELRELHAELTCWFEQIATIEKRVDDLLHFKDELILCVLETQKKIQDFQENN